jgi:beta-glucanase (GH16 family)
MRVCPGAGYNHGTMKYTSARLITKNKFEAKRGAWETKFKLYDSGNVHGKWPSFRCQTAIIFRP